MRGIVLHPLKGRDIDGQFLGFGEACEKAETLLGPEESLPGGGGITAGTDWRRTKMGMGKKTRQKDSRGGKF